MAGFRTTAEYSLDFGAQPRKEVRWPEWRNGAANK